MYMRPDWFTRRVPCDIAMFDLVWTRRALFFLALRQANGLWVAKNERFRLYEWHQPTKNIGPVTAPLLVTSQEACDQQPLLKHGYTCIGFRHETDQPKPLLEVSYTHARPSKPVKCTIEEYRSIIAEHRRFLIRGINDKLPPVGDRIAITPPDGSPLPGLKFVITCAVQHIRGLQDHATIIGFELPTHVNIQKWGK